MKGNKREEMNQITRSKDHNIRDAENNSEGLQGK
jgi:hypothetical protein